MKYPKLLSLALAATISASTIIPSCAYALISGDVNNDGAITSEDLTLLQEYVLGKNGFTKDQAASADINGDKVINSSDVVKLRKTILETAKDLSFKSAINRLSSEYKDTFKNFADTKNEYVIKSTTELKSTLSPYVSDTIVNNFLTTYNDQFFSKSVLLLKPFYYDPAKYNKNNTVSKLSCGCTNTYAGIYTPDSRVDKGLNIRKEHTAASDSLGIIPPGAKFTVTHANGTTEGKFGHVTYNGISGYINMGWVTKVSDLAPAYTSIPDVKINSVKYDKSNITVTVQETTASNTAFAAAVIAQAILPKKEYYATSVKWTVTTTSTTTTTTTTTTTCKYPLAKARMDKMGIKTLQDAFYDCYKKPDRITKYSEWEKDGTKITLEQAAEYGFKNRTGNCYVLAAMFCEMARLLGYDAHLINGKVPLAAAHGGGYGPHGWVEIPENGTNYIYDPDYALETGNNGFKLVYGNTAWSYIKIGEIK